nr:MAG TPA: hypothetical protein [Caudoviricetes sp.]DAT82122.1 MAG TPA: hypothetical protein [Caudoviricetes sp.]
MHFLLFSLFDYILFKKLLRATIKPSFFIYYEFINYGLTRR